MKLLLSLASLLMVAMISCGDSSPEVAGISWDDYLSQIDNWQQNVDSKLAEAGVLLEAGPMDNDEWLSSINQLGIEIDSVTFAVSTVHPPSELQEFHDGFVLATDFYKLAGKLLFEHLGKAGFLEANIAFALAREDLGEEVRLLLGKYL